jgi:hypothetical protein
MPTATQLRVAAEAAERKRQDAALKAQAMKDDQAQLARLRAEGRGPPGHPVYGGGRRYPKRRHTKRRHTKRHGTRRQ